MAPRILASGRPRTRAPAWQPVGGIPWAAAADEPRWRPEPLPDGVRRAGPAASAPVIEDKIAQVLAGASSGRVDIPIVGDSVTVGQGASAMSARYATVLNGLLRARFPGGQTGSGGGLGFIPLYSTGLTTWTWPVTATGDTSTITLGPVRDASAIGDAATWTWTAPGGTTSMRIMYYNTFVSGSFTWQVGSGAVTTVSNSGTGNGSDGQLTSSITISGGQVLTISFASGDIFVSGILHYAGDEASGLTVHALGHSGWTADTGSAGWNQALSPFDFRPGIAALVPGAGALGVFLGFNDSFTGIGDASAATFQGNLSALVAYLQGSGTLGSLPLLIIAGYEQSRPMAGSWPDYVTAMESVATAAGAQLVGLGTAMGTVAGNPGPYADQVHPDDSGHALLAATLSAAIS